MQAAVAAMRVDAEDCLGTRMVLLSDGRMVGCHVVGVADGPTLIHSHSRPGSRIEAVLLDEAARRRGVRIIGVDRPGFGLSTAQPGRQIAGWAHDVLMVADRLGVDRFCVSGWGEGGPYALACAAILPADRVPLAVVAGWRGQGGAAANVAEFSERTAVAQAEGAWRQLLAHADLYDIDLTGRPGMRQAFVASAREGFRQEAATAADAETVRNSWGFDVLAIRRPVHFWHGRDDRLGPLWAARQVALAVPFSRWSEIQDGGSLVMVGEIDAILDDVVEALW
jgi:pimeloyl-ACP methyl ester carboxylesterase